MARKKLVLGLPKEPVDGYTIESWYAFGDKVTRRVYTYDSEQDRWTGNAGYQVGKETWASIQKVRLTYGHFRTRDEAYDYAVQRIEGECTRRIARAEKKRLEGKGRSNDDL